MEGDNVIAGWENYSSHVTFFGAVGGVVGYSFDPQWPEHADRDKPKDSEWKGVGVLGFSLTGPGMVARGKGGGLVAKAYLEEEFPWPRDDRPDVEMGYGVIGEGKHGVRGVGSHTGVIATGNVFGVTVSVAEEGAIGIHVDAHRGPAAVFRRGWEGPPGPQVHIEPQLMGTPAPEEMATVSVFPPDVGNQLPMQGKPGDLMMTIPPGEKGGPEPFAEASLWLCVVTSEYGGRAVWRQVLLGPRIEGNLKG